MRRIFRCLIFLAILFNGGSTIYAQRKLYFHFDLNYLQGVREQFYLGTLKSGLSGFDVNLAMMYDVNNRLSAGIGIGAELLNDPNYTIFPVFAKVAFAPITSTEKPFIFAKVGYGIETKASNPGLLLNPGIGYKMMFGEHFGIQFMLAYHLQSIRYDLYYMTDENYSAVQIKKEYNTRHSISLGVGLIF